MTQLLRTTICFAALLFSFVLSGCGTMQAYPGERRPPDQVALIKVGGWAELLSVNGQELASDEDKAEVLPGSHTITTRVVAPAGYQRTLISNAVILNLDTLAGHIYEIYGATFGGGWFKPPTGFTIWIQDKESKEVVAGEKPQ